MLLEAVVIVLREVLEAALLVALLLSLLRSQVPNQKWLFISAPIGALVAFWYAQNIGWLSELWDYSGQEVINASLQVGIFLLTLALLKLLRRPVTQTSLASFLAGAVLVLAVSRELSEIVLYLRSYPLHSNDWWRVLSGGGLGAATGACVGIFIHSLLVWAGSNKVSEALKRALLSVVVAGILLQVVSLLQQVDHLPSPKPLWDSSALLPESSVFGQLLYALLGYEATPTLWHVGVYLGALALLMLVAFPFRTGPSQDA